MNSPDDIFIAVMGMTGVGKSSFIEHCTKPPERLSSNGLFSCKIQEPEPPSPNLLIPFNLVPYASSEESSLYADVYPSPGEGAGADVELAIEGITSADVSMVASRQPLKRPDFFKHRLLGGPASFARIALCLVAKELLSEFE